MICIFAGNGANSTGLPAEVSSTKKNQLPGLRGTSCQIRHHGVLITIAFIFTLYFSFSSEV